MECVSCRLDAEVKLAPPRERAYVDARWRVVHAWSSLAGWLVVLPRRHVEALDELTPEEAAELGVILRAASAALREAVGCRKTYVMLFAEQEGFAHVHFHVVPRAADLPPERRGVAVFEHLRAPEAEWVPGEERDRIATLVGARIAEALAT